MPSKSFKKHKMEFGSILISENAANSENPQDIINSNISIVNLMREEKIDDEDIHPDALMSYYLDYYVAQYTQGNFSQFVYNSGWNNELNELIEEGLELLGAKKHLELFQQQSKKVRLMSSVKLAKFLKGKSKNAAVQKNPHPGLHACCRAANKNKRLIKLPFSVSSAAT